MKYGDIMRINKKLLINMLVFVFIGAVLAVILYLLNLFNIISKDNTLLNIIIYGISAVVCIAYYIYLYKKCRDTVCGKDCLIELITYLLFGGILTPLSLSRPGVHLSIVSIWVGSTLSILIYNCIYVLREKDKLSEGALLNDIPQTEKYRKIIINITKIFISRRVANNVLQTGKYNSLILIMKIWVNAVFVGMFIFGIVNLFSPIDVPSQTENMSMQIRFFNNLV